jgi:hypothetical protein
MVIANVGPMQRSMKKGLATLAPFSKVIRALKRL